LKKITSDVCAKQNNPELAHLCLTPSTFENSTFFVRSQHTRKSYLPGLIRKNLQIRIPSPASAPILPGLKMIFITGQTKENPNHSFIRYIIASRETTELLQAIKQDIHISAKYTSLRWQEHNAIGRALPRSADP
jgi:hypothetical protein